MPLISVVIVNYNGRSHLKECLDSLGEQTFRDFEIILVDNASTDGSVDFAREQYPGTEIVEAGSNLGYGGGNNLGISASHGEYLFLLNNDTKVDPNCLQALSIEARRDESVGMWACKIMNYSDRETIDNTGLLMYRDGVARGRGRLEADRGQYDVADEVFFPSGCAGLYRRKMFDEIGLFDEDLFLYLDDVDVGLRGRLAGWKCTYVPDAVVYHKYSATVAPYSPLKAFLVERNRIWVVLKYFPLGMIISSFYHALRRYAVQGYGVLRRKGAGSRFARGSSATAVITVLVKAYASAFLGALKVLRKRRAMSRIRKVETREIRRWFRRFGIGVREVALKD